MVIERNRMGKWAKIFGASSAEAALFSGFRRFFVVSGTFSGAVSWFFGVFRRYLRLVVMATRKSAPDKQSVWRERERERERERKKEIKIELKKERKKE